MPLTAGDPVALAAPVLPAAAIASSSVIATAMRPLASRAATLVRARKRAEAFPVRIPLVDIVPPRRILRDRLARPNAALPCSIPPGDRRVLPVFLLGRLGTRATCAASSDLRPLRPSG